MFLVFSNTCLIADSKIIFLIQHVVVEIERIPSSEIYVNYFYDRFDSRFENWIYIIPVNIFIIVMKLISISKFGNTKNIEKKKKKKSCFDNLYFL